MTSPPTDPAPFLIRPAEARDANAIAAVHRTSMREALPYLPDLHTADEDRAWIANVVLPHQEVWVAEAGGRVVGVAALDGDMLAQLYILPGEQGRGIGSALLAKAMARRPTGMRLYAFQRNTRARGFYERRGFVAVEFGDGSGNEEGEPDVLYQWTPHEAKSGDDPVAGSSPRIATHGPHPMDAGKEFASSGFPGSSNSLNSSNSSNSSPRSIPDCG